MVITRLNATIPKLYLMLCSANILLFAQIMQEFYDLPACTVPVDSESSVSEALGDFLLISIKNRSVVDMLL